MESKKRGAADFYELLDSFFLCDTFSFSFVQNGHVINKLFQENKNKLKTVAYFANGISGLRKDAFRIHLRKIYSDVERYKKCLSNDVQWRNLTTLLSEQCRMPLDSSSVPIPTPVSEVTMPLPSLVSIPDPAPSPITEPAAAPLISATSLLSVPSPTPPIDFVTPQKRRLRSDCNTCAKRRIQMAHLSHKNGHMRELVKRAKLRVSKNKTLTQKVMRKEVVEVGLRKECKLLKRRLRTLESTNDSSLKSIVTRLKRALNSKDRELAAACEQIQQQSKNITSLQKELREFQISNDYLVSLVNEQSELSGEEDGPQFKRQLRKVVYKSLLCHVPVAHSGALIAYTMKELGEARETKVPHKSTVARMAYELSALSSIQAAGALLDSDCATLCWDATTLDGIHINEVHVSSPERTFTISVARLPGGRATDYVNHISAAIDELAATYHGYSGDGFFAIKSRILSKISSTISDRAPVNHCVVQQLRTSYEADLIELNCNLHPLDGFASHTRLALQKIDREEGMVSNGRDCCAANFIYSISKLRYKQTGDPSGFKAFLKENDIPSGNFVRYVGNRLHVMFHMAGVIIRYQFQLKDYLERYCRNACRTDLVNSLSDARVIAQLRALGLCGKLVTGPWMTLFYHNGQGLSNLEMVPHLKKCFSNLEALINEPSSAFTAPSDVFGQCLPEDRVLSSLRETDSTTLTTKYLSVILGAFHKVMCNQLKEYLSGALSSVSDDTLLSVKSASPHNIWAERSLGMADALWRRAPNASVGFMDAKVKAKTNHTLEWLDSHDIPTQDRLIKFAVTRGSLLRVANIRSNKIIDDCVQLRLTELAQSRDKKARKSLEKEIKKALLESNHESPVFRNIEGTQKSFLKDIVCANSAGVLGALFRHTWESADGSNVVYWGRIREASPPKKTRCTTFTIGYWADQESSSEDYDLNAEAILADMITRDLTFL